MLIVRGVLVQSYYIPSGSMDDVIGRVVVIYWLPGRAGVPGVADSLGKVPVINAAERHK